MPAPKSLTSIGAREADHVRRTELVKQMMAKESAASDAKTARLKALRLARDAAAQPAKSRQPRHSS